MDILIILSVIAISIVNYIFIDKIYSIAELQYDEPEKFNIPGNEKNALLFGEASLCREIADILQKYGIPSEILSDINKLDKSCAYSYLAAVNTSDLENLTICSIGIKMMEVKRVIALCNKYYNKKIYEDNQIPYLCGSDINAAYLVHELLKFHNSGES